MPLYLSGGTPGSAYKKTLSTMTGTPFQSLRYFGSRVRGDADDSSDTDVLCVLDAVTDETKRTALDCLRERLGGSISVAFYGSERICEMFAEGHLFAWHLHNESVRADPFCFEDLIDSLKSPAPYVSAVEDIESLLELGETIPTSLVACPGNCVYEAGLLYLCTRNIGISLSWHSPRGVNFARFAPYSLGPKFADLPLTRHQYAAYMKARLSSTRGLNGVPLDVDTILRDCSLCVAWAKENLRKLKYEKAQIP